MTLDTPDALLFEQTVTRIAGDLRELGDTEDLDVRRARAVGILADPQHALDLMSGRERSTHPGCPRGCGEPLRPPHPRRPGRTSPRTSPRPRRGHGCCLHRAAGCGHFSAAHRLAQPVRRNRHQDHPPPCSRPRLGRGRGPARPTRSDARDRDAARRELRVPRMLSRLPELRPRPHHRIPTHGRRRTTGPNPTRKSRTPVPNPSPRQDPHRLALQTPRQRQLCVDRAHWASVPSHPSFAADPNRQTDSERGLRPPVGVSQLLSSDHSPRSLLDHRWLLAVRPLLLVTGAPARACPRSATDCSATASSRPSG